MAKSLSSHKASNPDYTKSNQKVKSVSYSPAVDPLECCKDEGPPGSFSVWMCLALCVLCCMTISVEFEPPNARDAGPTPSDDRDFPTFTPGNNGAGDINFSTSQYGLFIPIVFGSDKLNGNCFWASPIEEHVVGDTFYRTLNFALGICEGEINGVLRMWMGDKLILDNRANVDEDGIMQPNTDGFIMGATVDLTEEDSPLRNLGSAERATKISVFAGTETQLPEGIMVAEEGYENVPGYRGLAFIMFENFVLGSSSSIPNIYVEVTSNTQNLFPRLFGNLSTPVIDFDEIFQRNLLLDPSYDHFLVPARDVPDKLGLAVFNNNNLEEATQSELEDTHSLPQTLTFELMQYFATGFVGIPSNDSNQGYLHVFNPITGDLLDFIGPGGGTTGHSLTTGFASLQDTLSLFIPGPNGMPVDIFVGMGLINTSVGFAKVDTEGQISMVSTLNQVLPHQFGKMTHVNIDASFSEQEFGDNAPSQGTHVFAFTSQSGETTEIHVSRITVDSPTVTLSAPSYAEVATITTDKMAGTGFPHSLLYVLTDPIDKCLVLFVDVDDPDRGDRIVKWSPFTHEVVWSVATPTKFRSGTRPAGPQGMLFTQKYAWIDEDITIYEINLINGQITTVVESVAEQLLQEPTGPVQFYNGFEDSIAYFTNTADQNIVKVFLNRVTRSTVELGDIVLNLLQRVGLLQSDIVVSDLQALTLNGYTISKKQSLRTCFAELGQAFKYDVIESNGRLKYKTRGDTSLITVPTKHLADVDAEGWLRVKEENDISRIRKINLTYRDLDREYANNVQSFILPRYGSQSFDNDAAIDVSVPIVLQADNAKRLAEILLYAKLTYDAQYEGELPGYYENLDPGDVVTLALDEDAEETVDVRIRQIEIGADHRIRVEGSEEDRDIYIDQVNLFGSIGRYEEGTFPSVDQRIDPILISIPYRDAAEAEATTNKYLMFLTLLNVRDTAELPEEPLTVILDGTTRFTIDPPLTFPTWGFIVEPPNNTRTRFSKDRKSVMRVRIMSEDGAVLQSVAQYLDMLNDSKVNLAYVGGELLQFENAVDEGDGIWALTGLHRGRYGTDMFTASHVPGERFILLSGTDGLPDPSVVTVQVDIGASPRRVAQIFVPSNNPFQPTPISFYNALNFRPWNVADVRVAYDGDDAEISWKRRTRFNGQWLDGTEEVPLNEATESYDLYIYSDPEVFFPQNSSTYLRKVSVTSPEFTYTLAMQTTDGFDNLTDTLYIMVNQTGSTTGIDVGAAEQAALLPKAV